LTGLHLAGFRGGQEIEGLWDDDSIHKSEIYR